MKKGLSRIDFLLVITMCCCLFFPVVIAANFFTGFEPFHDAYLSYFQKDPEFNIQNVLGVSLYVILLTPGSYIICSAIIIILLYATIAFSWVQYGIHIEKLPVSK